MIPAFPAICVRVHGEWFNKVNVDHRRLNLEFGYNSGDFKVLISFL